MHLEPFHYSITPYDFTTAGFFTGGGLAVDPAVVQDQAVRAEHERVGGNNRLIQVVSPQSIVISQYSYDALGRRISKDVSGTITIFLYDNARIIEERDGSNNVQATYTYGNYIDEVLTRDAGANRYYYHQNTLWSVHALTDAAGSVVERYTYDAYGKLSVLDPLFVPLSSAPLAYFTFTGREYDSETGLYHYRARTMGRRWGDFTPGTRSGMWMG